ncbi:Spx/MgsR family RNA polymerase-binding regulatory protein [Pseudomonadota bacterium]
MKLKVYEYPRCSTCRKALQYLQSNEIDFKKIDISLQPPSKTELKKMLKLYDGKLKKLFNTSGQVYRQKKLGTTLDDMTVDEAIDLLADDGMLVKRPFLLSDNGGLVGFKKEQWDALLI